jgi:hypothetical protein
MRPPERAIRPSGGEVVAGGHGHQGVVLRQQFGRRSALTQQAARVFLQAGYEACLAEQVEVFRHGPGVRLHALVLLAQVMRHVVQRQYLPGIVAGEPEQLLEQGMAVNPFEREDVLFDAGFDQTPGNKIAPARFVPIQAGLDGFGIAAEIDVLVETEAESGVHFGVGPVSEANQLETPHQAFGETTLNQQRRRTQQHDVHFQIRGAVFVPEPLYGFRPVRDFLHFIDGECERSARSTDL